MIHEERSTNWQSSKATAVGPYLGVGYGDLWSKIQHTPNVGYGGEGGLRRPELSFFGF
jgi:hypothetical protein